MLDVDFLLAPVAGPRLVYCYRGGQLRRLVARALGTFAQAHQLQSLQHGPEQFAAALTGLFDGLHWTDLGDAGPSTVEAAMLAMSRHESGPSAIFLRTSSTALRSDAWLQLREQATVIDEATPTSDTIDAILKYALAVSDLSPPAELINSLSLKSYLVERLALYSDLGEVLADVDDYILTRMDLPHAAGSDAQPRVPEFALTRILRAFLYNPDTQAEGELLGQVLLRGDDEKLAVGALTTSTITLMSRYGNTDSGLPPDSGVEDLVLWATILLARHQSLAVLRGGYAPSWRGNPDLRTFVVAQLCRDYRRARRDSAFRGQLISRAGEALVTVRVLAAGDERAVENLRKRLCPFLATAPGLPTWFIQLADALSDASNGRRSVDLNFAVTFMDIAEKTVVVEQLTRRIWANERHGTVLFHGRLSTARDLIVSAWVKALLCESPSAGDACNRCESCRALISDASPSVAIARLNVDPLDKSNLSAAEEQVAQVRRLIFTPNLFRGRRVIVLDGVDNVRKQAVIRLLKSIEEAPALVSFLLLAERLDRVPAALLSRSTVIAIKPPR